MGQIRGMIQNESMLQVFFRLLGRLDISYKKDIVINEFNGLLNIRDENQYESVLLENG